MNIYNTRPATFYDLVEQFPAKIQEIAWRLRALIFEVFPQTKEEISGDKKFANAVYSRGATGDLICGIHPREDHCELYVQFLGGAERPGARLGNDSQGVRQFQINTLEEISVLKIGQILKTARANSQPAG